MMRIAAALAWELGILCGRALVTRRRLSGWGEDTGWRSAAV
jgi:hypothetical protein